jgi:hypothetical protein
MLAIFRLIILMSINMTPVRIILISAMLCAVVGSCIERREEPLERKSARVPTALRELMAESEQLRADPAVTQQALAEASLRHRRTVFEMMAKGLLEDAEDLWRAAVILSQADPAACRDCSLLAHLLATEAIGRGEDRARRLAAECQDRFLIESGLPQKFGTQHGIDSLGRYFMYPVDPLTTDAERARFDLSPLDSLLAGVARLNRD